MIVLQLVVWLDAVASRALAPHGMGRALCARGGAAPLSPEGFLLHPTEGDTHKLQPQKTTSLTRKKYFSN